MANLQTKQFIAKFIVPLVVPNGLSLEEQMNNFLMTLDPVRVIGVTLSPSVVDYISETGELQKVYCAIIVYRTV